MTTKIALGALALMIGCGGGRPEISTTQDNVCDEVASVACFDMYQCCSEGEIEDFLNVTDPRTVEQCQADVHAVCERQLATINFSLKNNHVRFDADVMNACLEAFVPPADNVCVDVSPMKPWTEACMDSAWVGIVANGGQCDFAYECAKDSFCNASRVCAALPTDGMPCSPQGCASGFYCGAGTCHPQLAQGGTCTSTIQCMKNLFCDTVGTHTCTPLHATGETCTGNNTCTSNTCLPGTCAVTGGTCFSNTGCFNHCAGDNRFCGTDVDCGIGTCSGTTTACSSNAGCIAPATCVFPVACVPGSCTGNIVCADAHIVIDYCRAVSELPLL